MTRIYEYGYTCSRVVIVLAVVYDGLLAIWWIGCVTGRLIDLIGLLWPITTMIQSSDWTGSDDADEHDHDEPNHEEIAWP